MLGRAMCCVANDDYMAGSATCRQVRSCWFLGVGAQVPAISLPRQVQIFEAVCGMGRGRGEIMVTVLAAVFCACKVGGLLANQDKCQDGK